jgi:hypothetical protein
MLWLPYIVIRKRAGVFRRWSIPLYFRGPRTVRQAIMERCPMDDPIRRCLEAA